LARDGQPHRRRGPARQGGRSEADRDTEVDGDSRKRDTEVRGARALGPLLLQGVEEGLPALRPLDRLEEGVPHNLPQPALQQVHPVAVQQAAQQRARGQGHAPSRLVPEGGQGGGRPRPTRRVRWHRAGGGGDHQVPRRGRARVPMPHLQAGDRLRGRQRVGEAGLRVPGRGGRWGAVGAGRVRG